MKFVRAGGFGYSKRAVIAVTMGTFEFLNF